MDRGRREHVAVAIDTLKEKKRQALVSLDPNSVHSLDKILNVTSAELRVAATFQTQQIRSLSLPSDIKFLLWLTLQNDSYFRGGRAASERLSAARIGERVSIESTANSLCVFYARSQYNRYNISSDAKQW